MTITDKNGFNLFINGNESFNKIIYFFSFIMKIVEKMFVIKAQNQYRFH